MKLVIISGRSGSGKTICLHALEDLGFYCIDNLPVSLIPTLVNSHENLYNHIAISIDVRNLPTEISELKDILETLNTAGHSCEILYLDAIDATLLTRYSETRRKHPLTIGDVTLAEALQKELQLLCPLADLADLTINTSQLGNHQLSQIMQDRYQHRSVGALCLLIQSFGFKHGIPADADYVFDVRCLPNPYWQPHLRAFSGLDQPVKTFLKNKTPVQNMIKDISQFLSTWLPQFNKNHRSYMSIAVGCTGGQHRSVYIAEEVKNAAASLVEQIQLRHRNLTPPPQEVVMHGEKK